MIIAFIYINFERTSKSAKKCQKELGTFVSSKKCQEVSKNAKFAFFGTKNARLATMCQNAAGWLLWAQKHFPPLVPAVAPGWGEKRRGGKEYV